MAKQVSGHILKWVPGGGQKGREYEHIQVVEKKLGRKLSSKERVHHKDGNPANNKLGNLQLLASQGAHNKIDPALHKGGRKKGS
jgi:hypothetical protein